MNLKDLYINIGNDIDNGDTKEGLSKIFERREYGIYRLHCHFIYIGLEFLVKIRRSHYSFVPKVETVPKLAAINVGILCFHALFDVSVFINVFFIELRSRYGSDQYAHQVFRI